MFLLFCQFLCIFCFTTVKKSLQRWDRLRQYVEAGVYRLLLPREETDPVYREELRQKQELNEMMKRMDARERTFFERRCKQKGGTNDLLPLSGNGLLVTPGQQEEISPKKDIIPAIPEEMKDNKIINHIAKLALERKEGCLSSRRQLQPVIDPTDDYDYDKYEGRCTYVYFR